MKYVFKYRILIPIVLAISVGIAITVYTAIRNEIGIHLNDKIILQIKESIKKDSLEFQQINDFLIQVNTYSKDFKIENHPRMGIRYESYTDIKKSNMSFEEYQAKNYKDIPFDTSPCYVPDFDIPKELFKSFFISHQLRAARVQFLCEQKTVMFKYKYRCFYPTDRDIYLYFFPEKICDSIQVPENKNPEGYNWIYKIDQHWIIESRKQSE